jgi:hypothetical protein
MSAYSSFPEKSQHLLANIIEIQERTLYKALAPGQRLLTFLSVTGTVLI